RDRTLTIRSRAPGPRHPLERHPRAFIMAARVGTAPPRPQSSRDTPPTGSKTRRVGGSSRHDGTVRPPVTPTTHANEVKSMRSDTVKKGFERAPHRSLLRATGNFIDGDE